ncbi:hypothetical protein FRX31_029288 [Thalictrum thalictroides]|uniref:Uncharacterized protein n=1 Tax=Thalictrum thalictroides TaxID=46969 RepID=A0A7J6VAC5_THATH|nr:hypothetical protein FRX31_029288 [Thalictrum thalictroides]
MDTKSPENKPSQEETRESLIALSECTPESVSASKHLPDNGNSVNPVDLEDGDEAEKCRSELISISYTQSPDVNTLPVALKNHNN